MGDPVMMNTKHPLISLLLCGTVQYSTVVLIPLDGSSEAEMFLVLSV